MSEAPEATLARPKKKTSKAPPPSRRLSVQASDEWIAWVEAASEYYLTDVSKLVDAALTKYIKDGGFGAKPPKRVP